MTITVNDDIWLMRIAGVVTDAGAQRVFATRATTYGSADIAAIRGIPTVTGATAAPVDTIASDAGLSVELTASAAVLTALHRVPTAAVLDAAGGAVRTTAFISRTATSFTVTDATNISVGDYLWFDNELVVVTAKSTNTLTVTRGQGGTTAVPHAFFAPGLVLWPAIPQLRGAHVTVSRVAASASSSSDETQVWVGVVDGRSLAGGVLSLSLSSYWQGLSRATFVPPRALRTAAQRNAASIVWVDGVMLLQIDRPWYISADQYGELNHEYWRIIADDGRWVVVNTGDITTGTATVAGVLGEAYDPSGDGYLILQAGRGSDELYDLARLDTPQKAADALGDGRVWSNGSGTTVSASWTDARIEYAWVLDSNDGRQPGSIVSALLKATALPWSMCLGAPSASVDETSLTALNDALADTDGARSYGMAPAYERYWVAPYWPDADTKLTDVLNDVLQALGCVLAPSRTGQLRTWAWTGVMVPGLVLTGTEHREVDVVQSAAPAPLASVTFERRTYDGTDRWHRISAVAVQLRSGGKHLNHTLRALAAHAEQLWDGASLSLLAQYEREPTRATLLLGAEVTVQVGDVLLLDNWTQVVGVDGVRGSSEWRALVTRVQVERSRTSRVDVLLLGTDRGGRWSHSFVVAAPGYSGGKLYINPEALTSDDLSGFTTSGGVFVVQLDDELEDDAMTATEVTGTGVDGTGTYLLCALTTAVAGDIITLASHDDTVTTPWAWMADTAGKLGAANADAQRYE